MSLDEMPTSSGGFLGENEHNGPPVWLVVVASRVSWQVSQSRTRAELVQDELWSS